jgi:hypothetical protein
MKRRRARSTGSEVKGKGGTQEAQKVVEIKG